MCLRYGSTPSASCSERLGAFVSVENRISIAPPASVSLFVRILSVMRSETCAVEELSTSEFRTWEMSVTTSIPAYSGCPSISSFVNVLNERIFTFLFCILWFARMLFKRSSMFNPSTKVRSRFVIIMTTFGASRPVFSIISDSL